MSLAEVGAPDVAPPRHRRRHDCPPTSPEGFFAGRTWSWCSGPRRAVDYPFQISCEGPAELWRAIDTLTRPLEPGKSEDGPAHYRVVSRHDSAVPLALYLDRRRLLLARSAAPLLRFLTWHLNQQAITLATRAHVVLHAAAATRAGITVVLPGDQERGKTTTVAGLLREGYDYVTDEAVAIDPTTGTLRTYPKPLSMDAGSWGLFPECRPRGLPDEVSQWQVPAETLGARSLQGVVQPPRLIVFPRYTPGGRTRAVSLSPAEALCALVETTFDFAKRPAVNLETLARIARTVRSYRLETGVLDEAVLVVERLVSDVILEEL